MAKPTKAQLQAQAQSLGLPTGGTMADLQRRISEAEEQSEREIAQLECALSQIDESADTPEIILSKVKSSGLKSPDFDELLDDTTPKAHHAVTKPAAIGAALFRAVFG